MLYPTNTTVVPRGGWTVTIEGAGPMISSITWSDFIKTISTRLIANGLDHHGWREEMIDLMCRQRPDIESFDNGAPPSRAVTSEDLKRFVRTIWEAKVNGAEAVSPEEQDRRAQICMACPKKGYVSCGGGCGAFSQLLSELTIGSKARSYPELHKTACIVCGCELSSLIMYPLDVLQAVDAKIDFKTSEYDAKCWKLEPAATQE